MPPSQHAPPHQSCPQPDQTPSYATAGFEDAHGGSYPTLPAYMNPDLPAYPTSPQGRRARLVERYHHWWRLRDSIFTGFFCLGIVAAYVGFWAWGKRREDCLSEGERQRLETLLGLLQVVVAFTALTIVSIPLQYNRLADPEEYHPSVTVLLDVTRLLYWGGVATWLCLEPATIRLVDAELSFYWNGTIVLCVALGSVSIFKLAMRIPGVMEVKWGGEIDGQTKCQEDMSGRAVV